MLKKIRNMLPVLVVVMLVLFGSTIVSYAATALKISKQPVSVKVPSGEIAKVSITVKGEGLKYKWYFKDTDDKKYTQSKSVKGKTYSVKMSNARNGRKVYCVVTDKKGNKVKSKTVSIKKAAAVKITTQPKSVKVLSGSTAKVTVKAKGDGLTYKWYVKNPGAKKYTVSKSVKGSSYSVKMSKTVNGRLVYCVITDKYGKKVKSNTVSLKMATAVKIKTQPASASVSNGKTATVNVVATGDGLKYAWYFKDADSSKFSVIKSATSATYSVKMSKDTDGGKLYCVITDKYGKSVTSNTVTLSFKHEYGSAKVTKAETCSADGEKTYTCKHCGNKYTETIGKLGHSFGSWKTVLEPTVTEKGYERKTCSRCAYYEDRDLEKLPVKYNITVKLSDTETYKVGVAANGKYALDVPKKVGYNFAGWKTEKGESFAASGEYKANIIIVATWTLDGTDTLAELVERTDAGVSEIKVTNNIVVNQPLFINDEVKIYSDENYSIKRDPKYAGDIFVVGENRKGELAINKNKSAILNLGGGKGTLTIDGNKDALTVTVVGSAVYVSNSATLNIYDGVCIANNKKLDNERVLKNTAFVGENTTNRAGGAAVLNLNATVNMYGGVIENNEVGTEYTIVDYADGTQSSQPFKGCGGAIYNRGNFNMYGGILRGNIALRGGAIYSDFISYLYAGQISDNYAYSFGGGLSSSSTSDADIFIGSEDGTYGKLVFSGNHCKGEGGAIYSNTSSPVIIYGNTEFTNNSTDISGGAIYTAGPLTVNGATFTGNTAVSSGGAIYHRYTKAEFERREINVADCIFTNNKANLGGAIIFSSTVDGEGTLGCVANTTFEGNEATIKENSTGNGGAIYITRLSDVEISNCTFNKNSATGNGGAVNAQSGTNVALTNISFNENSARNGGGLFAVSTNSLKMTDVEFTANTAILNANGGDGLGGGMYLDQAQPVTKNIDFKNNIAGTHGGAAYLRTITLNLEADCEVSTNKAGKHGGAFYLTYITNDANKIGATLNATGTTFTDNSAVAGGAVSARSSCTVNMDSTILKGNSVSGYIDDGKEETVNDNDGDGEGGGAIYVGIGEVNLTDVIATGNTASDFGGVINAYDSTVVINGGSYSGNSTNAGGVIHAMFNSNVTVTGAEFNGNKSVYVQPEDSYNGYIGGGAINVLNSTLDVKNSIFENNETDYYGAAILSNGSTVNISENSVFVDDAFETETITGGTGAALCFRGASKVTLADINVSGFVSTTNGVIYQNGGNLDMIRVRATNNIGANGGVLFASGASTDVEINDCNWSENESSYGGIAYLTDANITIKDSEISNNKATGGGAVYAQKGTVHVLNSEFKNNKATAYSGGAICMTGGSIDTDATSKFINNTAVDHAGAIYVSYYKIDDKTRIPAILNATGTYFDGNTAKGGGAISMRTDCKATLDGVTLVNNSVSGHDGKADGYGEGGGAVYVGFGELTMTDVVATGNSSENFGGAVQVVESTASIIGGTFTGNSAVDGGAVYISLTSDATVKDVTFTENTATGNGGAMYTAASTMDVSNLDFTKNTAGGNAGALYVCGLEFNADSQWTFSENTAGGHGGAVYLTYKRNNDSTRTGAVLNATDVTFYKNSAMAGGAVSARSVCTVNMNGTILTENSVSGFHDDGKEDTVNDNDGDGEGGGAIYVGFGKVNLTDVIATDNIASDFGGVINAYDSTVVINGGSYSGNSTNAGGVIHAMFNSNVTVTGAEFNGNKSVYVQPEDGYNGYIGGGAINVLNSTLDVKNSIFENNDTDYYGAAILSNGSTVNISENSVFVDDAFETETITGGTGAALCFRGASKVTLADINVSGFVSTTNGVIYQNSGTLDMLRVTATDNKGLNGGVLFASDSAKVTIADSIMEDNVASMGGAVYVLNNVTLDLSGNTFKNNHATSDGGAVYTKASTVKGTDTDEKLNVFTGNRADNHGGAIYVNYNKGENGNPNTPGVINLNGGLLDGNTALAGGAISARTSCIVNLTDTVIKGNSATAPQSNDNPLGGGAIYSNNGEVTLSGVTLDGNTSAYYGGATYTVGSVLTIKDNSVIKNNMAITGTALWMNISADQTATIDDISLTGNRRVTGNSNGTIYATGAGSLDISNLTATDNISSNGGVMYTSGGLTITMTDSTLTGNEGLSLGGVLAYRGTKTMTINNTVISGNNSVNGGAIEASGSGTLTIKASTIENNTATTNGGGIYATGSANVVADKSLLKGNTAKTGGAIYLDLGATVIVNESTIDGNSSTAGDGGAIHIADSSKDAAVVNATKLVMNDSTLQNNVSAARGGALATDGTSVALIIEATNCTFTKNTSTTSGGAVCVQNSNCNSVNDPTVLPVVFTNCVFTDNQATTDGGALDVRTSSCVKIDGITAECNKATGNAGVVYVTSIYSRLYLTGTVVANNNTAVNGKFSYLYNNNYTTPPKIYTTHSNDAAWYADVAGNRTNVAFNLGVLP